MSGLYNFMDYLKVNMDKKNPVGFTTTMPQHPTGFMYLDYGVGSNLVVYDDDENPIHRYHNIGITSGSVNVIISKSQGGKTTLAIEMGMAIIEPYINQMLRDKFRLDKDNKKPIDADGLPFVQILDTEKTLPIDYVKKLTKYSNKLLKKHTMINPISTDKDLMSILQSHIRYKVEHMKPSYAMMLDIFGNPIIEYPPTVVIIDSMSQLLLEEVDDPSKVTKKGSIMDMYESATQGPAGARRAKIISALYSQLVNYAKRYNIIIFSINHINKMPAMMGIPVKQYRGLRAGETIGGGERAIYLAANILRIDVIKSVGGESSSAVQLGDGITGHVAIASWIKSKSNSKSNTCQLVYTNRDGYNMLRSGLWYAKEKEHLAKAGNKFYLNDYPEYKFTMKDCMEVFAEHPSMITAYYTQLRDVCAKMLDDPDNANKKHRELMESVRNDLRSDANDLGKRAVSDIMDIDDMFSEMINS